MYYIVIIIKHTYILLLLLVLFTYLFYDEKGQKLNIKYYG